MCTSRYICTVCLHALFLHALLVLEYPLTKDCHSEGVGSVQFLDGCILRLGEQTSLIVGYVEKANDFRKGLDRRWPIILAVQDEPRSCIGTGSRITPHHCIGGAKNHAIREEFTALLDPKV